MSEYQLDIISNSIKYYRTKNIGYVKYCDISNKTILSYKITKEYNNILIISKDINSLYRFYNDWLYNLELNKKIYNVLTVGEYKTDDEKPDIIKLTCDINNFIKLKIKKNIIFCLEDYLDAIGKNKLKFDIVIYDDIDNLQKKLSKKHLIFTKNEKKNVKYISIYDNKYIINEHNNIYQDIFNKKYGSLCVSEKEWNISFKKLNKWIENNERYPVFSINDTNEEELELCRWYNQQYCYYHEKRGIFLNEKLYDVFKKFLELKDIKLKEISEKKWIINFKKFKIWVNENKNNFPKKNSENDEENELSRWMKTNNCIKKYKLRVFENKNILNMWIEYLSEIEILKWYDNFNQLIEYINVHGHWPTKKYSPDFYNWPNNQIRKYKKQELVNEKINNEWKKFIVKYKNYIGGNIKKQWKYRLNCILDRNECFSEIDIQWIEMQFTYYKEKKYIMENHSIRNLLENEYSVLRNKLIELDKKYKSIPKIENKVVNDDSPEILFDNITIGTCKKKIVYKKSTKR